MPPSNARLRAGSISLGLHHHRAAAAAERESPAKHDRQPDLVDGFPGLLARMARDASGDS